MAFAITLAPGFAAHCLTSDRGKEKRDARARRLVDVCFGSETGTTA
jgi:hypothetical protein